MKLQYILLFIIFSSCTDFLEELPKDRLSEENFYNTMEEAEAALVAIYNPLRSSSFRGPYFLQTEIMADYANGRGSTANIGEYQGLDVINIARVELIWNDLYRSIRNANIAIERISEIPTLNEFQINSMVAEARFMRAFSYYHLVRHWGDVPLVLASEQEYSGRSPKEEVYDAIIDDLEFSEMHSPDIPIRYGKPTKWAAKSLLADVYLTLGEWDKARSKSQEVIQSGRFELIEIEELGDWDQLFGPMANGTSEEIFYLKFNHLHGWEWPHNLLWSETTFSPFGNYVIYSTTDNRFIIEWDDNDLRKQWNIFTEYIDRNTGEWETLPATTSVLFSKWRDPESPGSSSHANDYPFLRYADILLIYSEAEALASGDVPPEALEAINSIRRRAYGLPVDESSPIDYKPGNWTVEEFQDTVLQERAYELFMEGKRWLDLKRTGKIKEMILRNLGKEVKDMHLWWPIPQQEIDTNPLISQADQNPGY